MNNGYYLVEDWDFFGDRIYYWKKNPYSPVGMGGIEQLVMYGLQDKLLTGNPQIIFAKTVFDRKIGSAEKTTESAKTGFVDVD